MYVWNTNNGKGVKLLWAYLVFFHYKGEVNALQWNVPYIENYYIIYYIPCIRRPILANSILNYLNVLNALV